MGKTKTTWTAQRVADELERQGCIFATVNGQQMFISHDEEVTGLYAWKEAQHEGDDTPAEAAFGDEDDGAHEAIADWLNTNNVEVPDVR